MRIPFALESYQSRALPFSAQRVVNYFVEKGPRGAKNEVILYNAPGIKSFTDNLAGAVRGWHSMGGKLYVVAGNTFYSVSSTGTATSIGTINTNDGRVSMAVNRADPQQLCLVDGTDGWIYDTTNGLDQIDDTDFNAADTVTFQDGYFIFNESGTSRFFISAIDDGTDFTATDTADAEGSPDAIVAVFSNHRELWVFGTETIEVWYNSGNADFPFERIAGAFLQRGCAAAFSIAAEDNTLFWLGDDRIVYRANGYTPMRISTHAIEEILRGYDDVSDAFAYFMTISGHKFYVLTFPTGRQTFVYDVATGLWHERESVDARYWRAGTYVYAFEKHLVGDAFQGRIGELDMDTFTEFGAVMKGLVTAPAIHNDRKRVFHRRFEVEVESGAGITVTETLKNLLLRSEAFDNATWTKTNTTVTADAATAPDATTTAEKIVDDATDSNHRVNQAVTIIAGATYTLSCYFKAGERTVGALSLRDTGLGNGPSVEFDLTTGTIFAVKLGTGTLTDSSITEIGSGWYRVSVTGIVGGLVTSALAVIFLSNSASIPGDFAYAGDGTSGLYAWGAQLVAGADLTTYIATAGATASRSISYVSDTEPQMWLDWSDDGGRTFSARKPFLSMGALGAYRKRLYRNRLGSSRDRIYRLTVSDAVKRSIIAAHLDAETGAF